MNRSQRAVVTEQAENERARGCHGLKCRNPSGRFCRVVYPEPMGASTIRNFHVNVPHMFLRGSEHKDINGGEGDPPSASQRR